MLGQVYDRELSNPEKAIEVLRGVPASDPARARAAAMIGELEFQARRAPEADRAFRAAKRRRRGLALPVGD